jgi:hypothetical protein
MYMYVTHVRRNQAGVQPFIRKRGPSLRRPCVVIWRRLCFYHWHNGVQSVFFLVWTTSWTPSGVVAVVVVEAA